MTENFKTEPGVYKITNTITNDTYIGSTVNVKGRIYYHKTDLEKNKHINPHLQSAWNKYGADNFNFSVFAYCLLEDRLALEQKMINKYKTRNQLYNIFLKAGSPLGSRHSEKTKQKQSLARKEYWKNYERPIGEKGSFYGKKHTEETKDKIGTANRARLKGNQHAKGNTFSHTPEQLEKMRNSWTPEMRKAASERLKKRGPWNKGLKGTYHLKTSGMKGKHHSKETKKKIAEGIKAFYKEKRRSNDAEKEQMPYSILQK